MVRQAPVICVMAPPIRLGAWLPFELLYYIYMQHAHTEKSECMYMLVHVFSSLIFPQSHTTIATRWQYRACVTSRHSGLQRTSVSHFIMQRVMPILSPLVFMPSLYSSFHNSKNFLFTSLLPFSMTLYICASNAK